MFRKASEKDISIIRQLAEESWQSAYANLLSQEQIQYMLDTMYHQEELRKHLFDIPNYHYYLIFDQQDLVGFMGFQHHYENFSTKLHRIYLLDLAKGKGIGKSAIDFIKSATQKSGDHRIILNVNKNNPAKIMYEKQGFSVYGEGVFDIGNGYVMDDYLMEFYLP